MEKNNMELFEEYFLTIKNNLDNNDIRYSSLKKYSKVSEKNLAHLSDIEMLNLLVDEYKIYNSHSLSNYKSAYSNYIDWYINTQNDELVRENIFKKSNLLKTSTLKKHMSKNIHFISEEEVNQICAIEKNQIYIETVVRSVYEGISSGIELARLTKNHIDFENNIIKDEKGLNIKISDRLLFCLDKIIQLDTWYQKNDKKRDLEPVATNGVFGFIPNVKTTNNIESRKLSCRLFITKHIFNKLNINIFNLYVSGFINWILKHMTTEEFIGIYEKERKNNISKLNHLASEYGFKSSGGQLTNILHPYILKIKSEYENVVID